MANYKATPASRNDIRRFAKLIRKKTGYENISFFPIVQFVELFCRKSWVKWFLDYAGRLMQGVCLKHPQLTTIQLGKNTAERLRQYVRLTVNSGNWIQHRSVSIVER